MKKKSSKNIENFLRKVEKKLKKTFFFEIFLKKSKFQNFNFFEKISKKMFFSKKFFRLFSKSFQYFLMIFFSGFSFRQAAPVQGACGGRAPRSPPGSLAGVEEEGGKTFEKR